MLTDGTLANAGAINAFADVNALHNVDATNTGSIEVQLLGTLTLDSTTFENEDGASRSTPADARSTPPSTRTSTTTAPPAR